jgi:G3E family GTPase
MPPLPLFSCSILLILSLYMLETLAISPQLIPVTIITGFLGSGKTTLLNQILQNLNGWKVAVLVNEFGDINIDSQLLIAVDEETIELTNGCICCTINDNLAEVVYRLLKRRDRLDYLVVETTGVANPLPIALTFLGTELRNMTHLDSIVTVVDVENFTLKEHYASEAALSQIAYGDIILLNKTDLVSQTTVDAIENQIRDIKEGTRILRSEYGKVPLPLILDVNLAEAGSSSQALAASDLPASRLNGDGFMSTSFQSDRPFALKKFQQFLDYHLPENVFRAKGILWFVESSKRHIFQLSGKRFTINDSEWETSPKNQIVFIGRKLNPLFLQQMLNNCLTR